MVETSNLGGSKLTTASGSVEIEIAWVSKSRGQSESLIYCYRHWQCLSLGPTVTELHDKGVLKEDPDLSSSVMMISPRGIPSLPDDLLDLKYFLVKRAIAMDSLET